MQHPGERQALHHGRGEAELRGGGAGVAAHRLRVLGSARVADVDGLGEHEHRGQLAGRLASGRLVAAQQVGHDLRVEEDRAVATELLGRVESLVAGAQEIVRRRPVVG